MFSPLIDGSVITGTHDIGLFFLSLVIAVFASYTALELAIQVNDSLGISRKAWIGACALVMGGGIWSMHFTAMLAFRLPLIVTYDSWITLLSLLAAIISSGFAFFIVCSQTQSFLKVGLGGALMGAGVSIMHYSGMAAMKFDGLIYYQKAYFFSSILIAVLASTIALWLITRMQVAKIPSAVTMGMAVIGMHYTGMMGTTFITPGEILKIHQPPQSIGFLVLGISGITLLILGVALLISKGYESIKTAHKILLAAIEQSPSAVAIVERNGKIIYANPSLASATGYSLEEVIGANPRIWKSDEHSVEYFKRLWDTILSGKVWRDDICNRKKTGDLYWELLSILPIKNSKGEITHFISTRVDDTERRRAEEILQQYAMELERSNKALDDFATIASHDLQEPLRKIIIFGDRLRSTCALDDKGKDYLDRMQKASERMQKFIYDLLEYSKISKTTRPREIVDLNNITSEVIFDLEVQIKETQGHVEIGDLPIIEADSLQMRQLFMNLLSNALKFHKPDIPPHILIKSKMVGTGQWEIAIQDNGIGFDMKYFDRIMKPFQRLNVCSEYQGNGIGLTICRKVVENHGGQITANSDPEKGTCFMIRLLEKQPLER